MKRKAKSEISDSAAKALKLQTRFVIIKMPVRQVIHSYLSSFLYPASTGSCFMKARQRKEKNKKYLKERYEEEKSWKIKNGSSGLPPNMQTHMMYSSWVAALIMQSAWKEV